MFQLAELTIVQCLNVSNCRTLELLRFLYKRLERLKRLEFDLRR